MNLSTDSTARMIASYLSGDTRPIIILTDICNIGANHPENNLTGAIKPNPELPRHLAESISMDTPQENALIMADDNDQKPVVAHMIKIAFGGSGAMTTKQLFDCLINSGDWALLVAAYGEKDAMKRVKQALYGMKTEGFLSRIDSKANTPWVPTKKLLECKTSDSSDSDKKDECVVSHEKPAE